MTDQKSMELKIDQARQKRSTARTDANEVSSRSHAIFHIKIVSTNTEKKKPKAVTGTITIVDLAGSERLNQSNTEGDRLIETKAINKSLTALRDVISALQKKENHVPYRNSKLTSILQNYLSKDSKTLVIINVSPCASHTLQTLNSLQFGDQLKNCSLASQKPRNPLPAQTLTLFAKDNSNSLSSYNRMNSGLKPANPSSYLMIRRDLEMSASKQMTRFEGLKKP